MKLLSIEAVDGVEPMKLGAVLILSSVCFLIFTVRAQSQEINLKGWPIPNLTGLVPYSITVKQVDGVEQIVEKFYTPEGGHVARISGNGKVFAYAVDHNREPPIDRLLVDPDGSGRFIQKFTGDETYTIPAWVSD